MALVKCRECSGTVADNAATCPHCGTRRPWQAKAPIIIDGEHRFKRGLVGGAVGAYLGCVIYVIVCVVFLFLILFIVALANS